ncbi:hypothetical protein M9H77_16161 [Catharanthus roseus]|uniref:Uncharacterized protein n=1 Tax=Catharanthus roseus TaxID=4058 RepID=A0ACC0B193_CATRO|nr:hypothetical protein M9H77_16161 [Catharanthus roseus]
MVGAVPSDSSYNTHDYTGTDYGVSSSEPFIGRHSAYMYVQGDRGLGEEHDRVRSLYIDREVHERVDDDGDGDDDDHHDGEDAGDEEQPMLVAPASGTDGRPRHGKGKRVDRQFFIGPAEGGPVDPELIPSYSGHVVGRIWRGQAHIFILIADRYMALTRWNLTDAQVVSLATVIGLMHLQSCIFQHPNSALLSAFVEWWQSNTNSFHMPWGSVGCCCPE